MLPTSELTPGIIYSVQVEFPLDPALTRSRAPLNLSLALGWRVLQPDPGRFLPLTDTNGKALSILSVDGPTLVDLVDNPPDTRYDASVTFGGPDLRTVYVGSLRGTRIPYFRSPVAGLPMVHW